MRGSKLSGRCKPVPRNLLRNLPQLSSTNLAQRRAAGGRAVVPPASAGTAAGSRLGRVGAGGRGRGILGRVGWERGLESFLLKMDEL